MGELLEIFLPQPASSSTAAAGVGDFFTVTELTAAEQLVQLSGSTTEDEEAAAVKRGDEEEEEDRNSSSASRRSVGTRPPDGEEEETSPRRMIRRYRALADLYAATKIVGDRKNGWKRKRSDEEERRQRTEGEIRKF